MKIAFSTLACPRWGWEKIVEEAARLGYNGIEMRGIEDQLFLPDCPPFQPQNLEKTKAQLADKGLEICCIDTSCAFHDPQTYESAIQEGIASIDLAAKLGTRYIRVFGNNIPDPARREETIAQVAQALGRLGRHAGDNGVEVLLETHGDFIASGLLAAVVEQASSAAVGVLWDIHHTYKFEGESWEETHRVLGPYVKHIHIKDSEGPPKGYEHRLVGQGDVPVRECMSLLHDRGYRGWYSLEWEKRWNPDIEEPEAVLPAFIAYMRAGTP